MKTIWNPFQLLSLLFWGLAMIPIATSWAPSIFSYTVLLIIQIAYLVAIALYGGCRLYTPFYVILIILHLAGFSTIRSFFLVPTALLTFYLRVFHVEVAKQGPFGTAFYRDQLEGIQYSVFYPCDRNDSKLTSISLFNSYSWNALYEITYSDPLQSRLPFLAYRTLLSYLGYLQTTLHTRVPLLNHNGRVIVFSHGLGSRMLQYCSLYTSWASNGSIVVAIQHQKDTVLLDYRPRSQIGAIKDFLYENRNRDLKNRCQQLSTILKKAASGKLFTAANMKPEINEVVIAGHSYGGATAIEASLALVNDPALKIKKVVALDPWFFPLSPSSYATFPIPVLILNSQTFWMQVPEQYGMERLHTELTSLNPPNKMWSIILPETDHLTMSDACFEFGMLLSLKGSIRRLSDTPVALKMIAMLIDCFLEDITLSDTLLAGKRFCEISKLSEKGFKVELQSRLTRKDSLKVASKKTA